MKCKVTKDKFLREKIFEIDEALEGENSRVSSFQMKRNDEDKNTKI